MFSEVRENFRTMFREVEFTFLKEEEHDVLTSDSDAGGGPEVQKRSAVKKTSGTTTNKRSYTVFRNSNLRVRYYYDEPGLVPARDDPRFTSESAPENGLDIQIETEHFSWGPWEDHQR